MPRLELVPTPRCAPLEWPDSSLRQSATVSPGEAQIASPVSEVRLPSKFELIEKLGEGGQAETFLVIDTGGQFGRVVLKRLKNPHRLPRFKQEIDALGKLDHPKVLKLLPSTAHAEKPYLVSE